MDTYPFSSGEVPEPATRASGFVTSIETARTLERGGLRDRAAEVRAAELREVNKLDALNGGDKRDREAAEPIPDPLRVKRPASHGWTQAITRAPL